MAEFDIRGDRAARSGEAERGEISGRRKKPQEREVGSGRYSASTRCRSKRSGRHIRITNLSIVHCPIERLTADDGNPAGNPSLARNCLMHIVLQSRPVLVGVSLTSLNPKNTGSIDE